jgi:hypothetical protein
MQFAVQCTLMSDLAVGRVKGNEEGDGRCFSQIEKLKLRDLAV